MERLYYPDSYLLEFDARVVERLEWDGRPAVVLDRTAFYPTGGGQPHDTGFLDDVPVLDVLTRPEDMAVLHLLAQPLAADTVRARIDRERRFDHMQQHTGQHILTRAFIDTHELDTVGFHLSADSVTIDLNAAAISDSDIGDAETRANAIVMANLPVQMRWIDPGEAESYRVRRLPDQLATERIRLIEIGDFDRTACGGTHVARTGEIGLIKITATEKRGDKTRVHFRCGGRALADYRVRHTVTAALMSELTCGLDEIPVAVARLRDELRETLRSQKAMRTELLTLEAAALLAEAEQRGDLRLVLRAYEGRDMADLRHLASQITANSGVVALLGSAGERSQIVAARSADLPLDMRDLLKAAFALLDSGRGGGQPGLAQGGGGPATIEQVQAALDAAAALL